MKGRKARPIEGLEKYNFAKLATSEGSSRERRRFLAFAHIQDGKSLSEAARMIKVKPSTVIIWVCKFRKDGIEGLKEKGGRGAKRCIPKNEEALIGQAVLVMQENRIGGRIRGQDIHEMVKRTYGKSLSNGSLYRLLHRVGLSWITGRSIHPKADIEKQTDFKKNSKKKSKE